jgi:hypothetical protein
VAHELDHANAQRAAAWLSTRPFVQPTTPRPVTVGGYPAYQVDVSVRPGVTLPSMDQTGRTAFTFAACDHTSASIAVSEHEVGTRYYFVDVPNDGLVLVWVASDGAASDVTSLPPLVDTLRFG